MYYSAVLNVQKYEEEDGLFVVPYLLCQAFCTDLGGIYFDNDVIALKPFDAMKVHPPALGRATDSAVNN